MYSNDDHFRKFAASLERAIDRYGETEDLYERQKEQIETLVALENELRKVLIEHRWGAGVYRRFIEFICDEKKNILAARPYFRERQENFTKYISKALKSRSEKSLYRFNFNFNFVLFVLQARKWAKGSKVTQLAKRIEEIRTQIVEMNMPLAISRARIFYSRTPKSQLTYMDLVQISCEGLMSAVDKFVPPFSRVFRSVAIGRMVGNFIEEYSETLLHFYPVDKRKIYRANKVVGRFSDGVDYERVAAAVNDGVDAAHQTSAAEIADLMAAASCVSADAKVTNDPEAPEPVERFAAPEAVRPDVQMEEVEAMNRVSEAMRTLTIFERKLLRLKGIAVP